MAVLTMGLWIGLPGIWFGGRVYERRGPDHLMHYPVGVPWFRGKVNTAKWVIKTGRLYAGGSLGLATLILTAAWWPTHGLKSVSACIQMTPLEDLGVVAGEPLEYGQLVDNGHRCEAQVRTRADRRVLLRIEVDAPQALIGSSLESQRLELERRSMMLRPLPTLGSEAVLAVHPDRPQTDAIILFTQEGSTVRVHLSQTTRAKVKQWVRQLRRVHTPGS